MLDKNSQLSQSEDSIDKNKDKSLNKMFIYINKYDYAMHVTEEEEPVNAKIQSTVMDADSTVDMNEESNKQGIRGRLHGWVFGLLNRISGMLTKNCVQ